MPAADLNPYAPPISAATPPSPSTTDPWAGGDAIELSGTLRSGDVRAFLRCYDHIPLWLLLLVWLLLTVFPTVVVLYVAALSPGVGAALIQGWPIAVGGFLAVTVMLTVSAIPYRQWVFQTLHPWWREPLRGTLGVDGLTLRRDDGVTFHRWDWFGDAVKRGPLVGLIPKSLAAPPVIITQWTLADPAQWQRVVALARTIANASVNVDAAAPIRSGNVLSMLRDPDRQRTVAVPPGAAAFAGAIYAADQLRMPRQHRHLQRPLRTYVVITLLFASLAMLVIGFCQLILPMNTLVPLLLAFGLLATMTVIYYRQRTVRGHLIYYLMGFVTDRYVVTDFGVTTTRVDWSDLQVVFCSENFVALRRRRQSQFVLLRRDMFAGATDWQTLMQATQRRMTAD